MYDVRKLPITPVASESSSRLPLTLLTMVPDIRTEQLEVAPFNVAGALSALLGKWDTVMKVAKPYIWAPGWPPARVLDFVNHAFPAPRGPLPESALADVNVPELSGLLTPAEREYERPPEYAIVHLARTAVYAGNIGPYFELGNRIWIPTGKLRDWLVSSGTRLLILQGADWWQKLTQRRFAEFIVGGGGPAVLTVQSKDAYLLDAYFMDLYANILHNRPLDEAADPQGREMEISLTYGQGEDETFPSGKDLLRFDKWMEELLSEHNTYLETVDEYFRLLARLGRSVHRTQLDRLRRPIDELEHLLPRISYNREFITQIRSSPWHHENEGVIPLADAAAELRRIQDIGGPVGGEGLHLLKFDPYASSAGLDVQALFNEALTAPRVLNAGFADAETRRVLGSSDPLVAERDYDLLVDVGPRWNRIQSLVTGQSDFPEDAFGNDRWRGHDIDVLFVSEDFLPRMVSGRIFLPAQTGRSSPYTGEQKSYEPRPLALRVRCRLREDSARPVEFRGRLSLYYRGNLLQSAEVLAWVVARREIRLQTAERNTIRVDFTLTSSFQELESRFAGRAVNITMNDDGSNSHRIVIKCALDAAAAPASVPPPAFVPYNPTAAGNMLRSVRGDLLSCFWKCDEQGSRTETAGLLADNSKSKDQFLFDLRMLALMGARLFKILTDDPNVEGDQLNAREWARALRDALAHPSVIQVARTGKIEYCFPWALVYDIPMPGPDFQFCPVTNDWDEQGARQSASETCPYAGESYHQENIYCPYGFWGMKHMIEQPLSVLKFKDGKWVLRESVNQIRCSGAITLSIGRTSDPQLNLNLIDTHLATLRNSGLVHFSPASPADDVTGVRNTLQTPAVVYFLCHGKFDSGKNEPYLGVGAPDDKYHQIYPEMVQDWADTAQLPNLSGWSIMRPFVFINGCHTCELKPEETVQFVSKFAYAEASGVLGTEISIQLPLAIEVGELLLESIAARRPVGQALRDMRWQLLNKGNLLGLSYTLYAMADLRITSD